ncbi:MAG: NUDIX hydrolase [Desulfobacterales bacterium]|nr:NUDIX hydrolase [Desulfobacterales bacterium]
MHRNPNYSFCPQCGGQMTHKLLKKGEPKRLVCSACEFVFYLDPKVAACVITEVENKIVILKRAIPPEIGKWVIPGGFVDVGETVPAAAARETLEEVRLHVEIGPLVGVYSYPDTPVVVIVYEAQVINGVVGAADEALEVDLVAPSEIPWERLAFTSTRQALRDYLRRHYPEV